MLDSGVIKLFLLNLSKMKPQTLIGALEDPHSCCLNGLCLYSFPLSSFAWLVYLTIFLRLSPTQPAYHHIYSPLCLDNDLNQSSSFGSLCLLAWDTASWMSHTLVRSFSVCPFGCKYCTLSCRLEFQYTLQGSFSAFPIMSQVCYFLFSVLPIIISV